MSKPKINSESSVTIWTNRMEKDFPVPFKKFTAAMHDAGFASIGHMFGQLAKAESFLKSLFAAGNINISSGDRKNPEQVKVCLEKLLENDNQVEIWKSNLEKKFPIAYYSLQKMLLFNNSSLEEVMRDSETVPAFAIWMSNSDVLISPLFTKNPLFLKKEIERALEKCEQIATELAWAA